MSKIDDGQLSATQIITIVSGIIIIPIILTVQSFGNQMETSSLVWSITIATIILTALALVNAYIGFNRRKTSDQLLAKSFGTVGYKIIVSIFALTITGWCIVSVVAFGDNLNQLIRVIGGPNINIHILGIIGCIIFVFSTGFGLQRIGLISTVCTSIVFILMIVIQIMFFSRFNAVPAAVTKEITMTMGQAITQIVGALIVLTVTIPDFGSFARTKKDALGGIGIVYVVLIPLLIALVVLPSNAANKSFIAATGMVGLGTVALLVMIVATISGNIGNFFKASLSFAEIFKKSRTPIVIIIGIVSAIVSFTNFAGFFFSIVGYLGVIVPTIAGVYICQEVREKRVKVAFDELNIKKYNISAFIAVILGSTIGLLTLKNILTITTISSLDSIIVTFIVYLILPRVEV